MSKRNFLAILILFFVFAGAAFLSHRPASVGESQVPVSSGVSKNCPAGFIKVSDFCVMKYDAKCTNTNLACVTAEGVYKNNAPGCACEGNFKIVSTASVAPITYIPGDDGTARSAKAYCEAAGWHLITNAEWMTIAREVETVPDNWCNKNGTGCGNPPGTPGKILANGHNDLIPGKALPAGADDQSCYGTTLDGSNICGGKSSQKRTLTLANGEIIWDFAGNVWQWVDAVIARKDEPHTFSPARGLGGSLWLWSEFSAIPFSDTYSPLTKGINSLTGSGRIFHYNLTGDTDTTLYGFIRGGNWRHGNDSGAFSLHMQPVPGKTNIDDIGFRCATLPD